MTRPTESVECFQCGEFFTKDRKGGYYGSGTEGSPYLCSSECFYRHFWGGYIAKKDSRRSVRVEGQHYWIVNDAPDGAPGFRGFGGRHWRVLFNDGRVIDTRNLWHQGAIPAWAVAEGLTDNAKFASWPVTDNGYVCVEEESDARTKELGR